MADTTGTTPRPMSDALAEYREGLARHELRVTRCPDCGRMQFPPRAVCSGCSSTRPAEWVEVSGRGVVWSFGVFHKAYLAQGPATPYAVAIVQLKEGPKLVTNIVGLEPADIRVGMPVHAVFESTAEGALVKFAPEAA